MARVLGLDAGDARDVAEALFAAEDDLLAIGCVEERLPFARLLVDIRHPAIYDVNGLRNVRGTPTLEQLEDAFARAVATAGCRHRRVASRDPVAVRALDHLLVPRAYTRQACLAMAHFGEAQARPVPRGMELVLADSGDDPLLRAIGHCQDLVRRLELWYSPEVSRQMDDLALRQVRYGGADLLAAVLDTGEVAGSLLLRCAAGIGFVADVGTAPSWRRRGVASALVAAAVAIARDAGCHLVGLTARRDDAPRFLYEALGFSVVGESVDWLRGA